MAEKLYAFAVKDSESESYSIVHNGNDKKIPVSGKHPRVVAEDMKRYLFPGAEANLEGVVVNITPLVIAGIIRKENLSRVVL